MFENIGMSEILVLLVAALFILGPERLPEAAAWLGRSLRKIREFATGARDQLREEMGPEFDEFHKPIQDLRNLRSFDPKRAVTQHLFDGDEDPLGMNDNGTGKSASGSAGGNGAARVHDSLTPGEKPPIDPDAT